MALNTRRIPGPTDPKYLAAVAAALPQAAAMAYFSKQGFKLTERGGLSEWEREDRERCRNDFRYFLRYWKFKNRETGEVLSFESLWEGQEDAVKEMQEHPWLFMLKAGKLGLTELECAWDGWVGIFRVNARVGLFSKGLPEAKGLRDIVKFGLTHLPRHLAPKILTDSAGGDTTQSLKLAGEGPDDERLIISYAATKTAAIDASFTHIHLDELSHVQDPKALWGSVSTVVPEGASLHIVTRGAGSEVYTKELWDIAVAKSGKLRAFFAPWTQRPGRDEAWLATEAGNMHALALKHYAPQTPEDALAGDKDAEYVPMSAWNRCYDATLPPLTKADKLVLGVDAAVNNDWFSISGVTRHPVHKLQVAHRFLRVFKPVDGFIDYAQVKREIEELCQTYHVVCLTYDRYQMEDMAQDLTRRNVVWCQNFSQQNDRLLADAGLHHAIIGGEFWHTGDAELTMAVSKAGVEINEKENNKMRIVKRHAADKIDPVVATSMARAVCMFLNL